MASVNIKVEAKGTGYWIAVGGEDIDLDNGAKTITLNPGVHYLTWWMIGKPGDSIKIGVTAGNSTLGKVETKITSGQDQGAGTMKLEVK